MMYVVIDNSGSMRDNGKASLAANVMLMFRRQAPPGAEIGFYKWGEEVVPIGAPADLDFSGRTNGGSLRSFLSGHGEEPVVLVGDGLPDRSAEKAFKNSGAVYLAVGCDSNPEELRRRFGANRVFSWADSMACLHTALSEIRFE